MRLTLSSRFKHEESFSSRSGRGTNKKGIVVTLSKEKQHNIEKSQNLGTQIQSHLFRQKMSSHLSQGSHQLNSQNYHHSFYQNKPDKDMSNVFSHITLENIPQKSKKHQKNIQNYPQNQQLLSSQINNIQQLPSNSNNKQDQKVPRQNLIGVYFLTSNQKLQAKRQAQKLDEHIKKLQFQIYNTRSKITETKYLYHSTNTNNNAITINTVNNNKDKIQTQQYDSKNNLVLPPKSYLNSYHTNQNSNTHSIISSQQNQIQNINNHQELPSQIKLTESNKLNVKGYTKQLPISPSSSEPPHPFLLKEMLTNKKSKTTKNPHLSLNLTNKLSQAHPETHNIQLKSNKNNNLKNNIKSNLKKSNQNSHTLNLSQNHSKVESIKNKPKQKNKQHPQSSRKNQKISKPNQIKSHQKRSFSANLQDKIITNNKKSLNLFQQNQKHSRMKKPKHSDFEFKIENYISLNERKNEQSQNMLKKNKFQKVYKNSKLVFTNEALTKKVSTKRKKEIVGSTK